MAGLLSDAEKTGILAVFESSFSTWNRTIVIYKEPTKTAVSQPSQNNLFGFGETQQDITYTLTPRTGVFQAVIRYNDIEKNLEQSSELSPEIVARIYHGPVSIKVHRDCRDFINSGPTERVEFDGQTFLMDSDERRQSYAGSEYYIFTLRKTK